MHVMQVLNHQGMVDTVEGFGEIDEPKDNSVGDRLVNSCVDEVKKTDQIVGYGCPLQSSAVGWVQIWLHDRHEPVTQKGLVHLTEEWCT